MAEPIEWCEIQSPLGVCRLAWNHRGLKSFELPRPAPLGDPAVRAPLLNASEEAAIGTDRQRKPGFVREAIARLDEYFAGNRVDFRELPLDLADASAFDTNLYSLLGNIVWGTTTTYGNLARQLGKPGAARAVGRGLGANPLPLILPCHRVLAAGGRKGGFSAPGGTETKLRLLALEGVHLASDVQMELRL